VIFPSDDGFFLADFHRYIISTQRERIKLCLNVKNKSAINLECAGIDYNAVV